jgi:hypothetical protein
MEAYATAVEQAASRAKLGLNDMTEALKENKKHSDAAKTAATELSQKLKEEFNQLKNATAQWLAHKTEVQNVITTYENLYKQIQKTIQEAQKLNNVQSTASSTGGQN